MHNTDVKSTALYSTQITELYIFQLVRTLVTNISYFIYRENEKKILKAQLNKQKQLGKAINSE